MPLILGLETSCDETSAAIVDDAGRVRASIVSSQEDLHARYQGIVPEIAARAHVERVREIVRRALDEAAVTWQDVDAIAVSDGPGLAGSLVVGVSAAKTLGWALGLPLVAVDHIAAHAVSAMLAPNAGEGDIWPAVSLVVSGGHTSLYHVRSTLEIELLGQTVDDAAGEAFDKVAAILELGYPGGPRIDRLSREGNPKAIRFPRTWVNEPHDNFSFSGLKTAVLYHVYGAGQKYGSVAHLSRQQIADVAASFQAALVETLVTKTIAAAKRIGVRGVAVGGGVAANSALRAALAHACQDAQIVLHLTPAEYCTDNAAMIALLAHHQRAAGQLADLWLEPRSGLRRPARK